MDSIQPSEILKILSKPYINEERIALLSKKEKEILVKAISILHENHTPECLTRKIKFIVDTSDWTHLAETLLREPAKTPSIGFFHRIKNYVTSFLNFEMSNRSVLNLISKEFEQEPTDFETVEDLNYALAFVRFHHSHSKLIDLFSSEKNNQILQANFEIMKKVIMQFKNIESPEMSQERRELLLSKIEQETRDLSQEVNRCFPKSDLSSAVEQQMQGVKSMRKAANIGLSLKYLDSEVWNTLLFGNHVYERFFKMGHKIQYNAQGEPVLPYQATLQFKKEELLPSDGEIEAKFIEAKRGGVFSCNAVEGGRKIVKGMNASELTKKQFVNHLLIERLEEDFMKLYNDDEPESSIDAKYVTRRYNTNGELEKKETPFKDNIFLDVEEFVCDFFDDSGGLLDPLPCVVFFPVNLTLDQLSQEKVLSKEGEVMEGFQYLGNGFTQRDPYLWRTLEPYRIIDDPTKRPKKYIVDIKVSVKGDQLPSLTTLKQGHAYLEIISPEGEVYSVGLTSGDPSLTAIEGALEQPDTRSFMLTPAFRDIAARYELPDKKAFTRLLRFLEGAQGYHESEQGSVKTSNITYQCLTESCASFAKTMKDYVVEDLGGKRVKAEDEARLFMTPFQISCEKAKMAFVNFLASTFLKWSIRRKKEILERDITLKGIPLKSIFEGRRVEEMEGYGSLEQRVEDQTFNLYLPRSLALEIIEEEFYLHHQFQTVKS